VYHADMRLLYQALRSDTSAIAVELVETSMRRELVPYLMPLIEDIPLDEKIEKGRRLFLLIRHDDLERLLTFLILSEDPVIRMLTLTVVADMMPDSTFVPVVESCLGDEDSHVRQVADYAWAKAMNEEARMPPIIETINKVKAFSLFEGLGIRELHAIATVITEQTFEPGDLIMREGEDTGSIFFIRSGKVAIHKGYGTSEARERLEAKAGDFLGLVSMLTGLPTEVTCVVVEQTETLVLPKVQFLEILKIYPQIGLNLCRFAALRFREVYFLD
jgi:CRP/FNR family transcriptional regulator, cyclic AMP receptor protein